MNIYEMPIKCICIIYKLVQLKFSTYKRTIRITDSPLCSSGLSAAQLADLPDLPTSLDKLTTIRRTVRDPGADCPRSRSGLSAIHLYQPTRTHDVSGRISKLSGGLSAPKWRTVRGTTRPTHQNHQCFWRTSRLTSGLSAHP